MLKREYLHEVNVMEIDTRKARTKNLKRILNSLTIEIKEIKARGLEDTEDLEQAHMLITRFCEKIWPFSVSPIQQPQGPEQNQDHQVACKKFHNKFSSKAGRV